MSASDRATDAAKRYPAAWTRWEEDEDDAYEVTPVAEPPQEQKAALAAQKRDEHAAYMRDWRRRRR